MYPNPIHPPLPLNPSSALATSPSPQRKTKSHCGSCGVAVCPTGYAVVHTPLLAKVQCNEPSVWFEIEILPAILLLPCVMESLQGWPLHELQLFIDGIDAGTGQLTVLDLGLSGSPPTLSHPHHQGQIYCAAQARCRAHSPQCYSW